MGAFGSIGVGVRGAVTDMFIDPTDSECGTFSASPAQCWLWFGVRIGFLAIEIDRRAVRCVCRCRTDVGWVVRDLVCHGFVRRACVGVD